tara:strand:- start:656 stop:901 length:246 start_codon:yes stop_codon:yes gene_type:complete
MLNIILYVAFVLCFVILISRIVSTYPNSLDIDITDPLSILDDDESDDELGDDICKVCARKKGSEPLLTCSDEKCINKNDKH